MKIRPATRNTQRVEVSIRNATRRKRNGSGPLSLKFRYPPLKKCPGLFSESVSTGVWCVPGFGAGFEIALKPSELQKEGENPGKGRFYFLRRTLPKGPRRTKNTTP